MNAGSKIFPRKSPAIFSPVIFTFIVLGATAIGAGAVIFFFNPSTHPFYPVCMFHAVTGLNCPGCGMTRALYALLHGNFLLALKDNALFILALAGLMIWAVVSAFRRLKNLPVAFNVPPKFLWLFLAVTLVFAVARNLPGFEWLAP